MPSLNMGPSYELTTDNINSCIESGRIGNYAYGYLNDNGSFVVKYVGRSDSDLRERIKHGITDMIKDPSCRYERFKFSYADSSRTAFIKECENYHDFGGDKGLLLNVKHPDAPAGEEISCPYCDE